MHRLLHTGFFLVYSSTMKIETKFFSEKSVDFQRTTWLYIQKTELFVLFIVLEISFECCVNSDLMFSAYFLQGRENPCPYIQDTLLEFIARSYDCSTLNHGPYLLSATGAYLQRLYSYIPIILEAVSHNPFWRYKWNFFISLSVSIQVCLNTLAVKFE
jgi:hypothetical protein